MTTIQHASDRKCLPPFLCGPARAATDTKAPGPSSG